VGREGTERETRDNHEKRARGILNTREIERTFKLELLRATASVEQRNAAEPYTAG
jgi:hypothetical protein